MGKRNRNVEMLRVISAFGIVWFHSNGVIGVNIAYSGLAVFIMLSFAYLVMKTGKRTLGEVVLNRFNRLIVPWIIWSSIYLVLNIVKSQIKGEEGIGRLGYGVLITGTSIHLWYLPFAFIFTIIIDQYLKITSKFRDEIKLTINSILIVVSFVLGKGILQAEHINIPFPQWAWGIPAVFIGTTIGLICLIKGKKKYIYSGVLIALVMLVGTIVSTKQHQLNVPYGIAILLTILSLMISDDSQSKAWDVVKHLATMTFGVYLIHPLISSLLHAITLNQIPKYLIPIIVFVISIICVSLMKKTLLQKIV